MSDQKIVSEITSIRMGNNLLWMQLLAIALEIAPDKTKDVLRQINENDQKINALLRELAE